VDDELAKRIRDLHLPMSEISREALWAAVDKDTKAVCKKCREPARYHIRRENSSVYVCPQHVALFLGDVSTVRAI